MMRVYARMAASVGGVLANEMGHEATDKKMLVGPAILRATGCGVSAQ
jgi:hypothetical protein